MRGRRGALGAEEQILLEARLHPLSLLVPLLLSVVGTVLSCAALIEEPHWPVLVHDVCFGVLGVSVLYALARIGGWRARRLLVTSDRLIVRTGLLRRRGSEVSLRRIVSLQTHQRLAERLVGRGTIAIETAGEGSPLLLHDVARPLLVARTINAAVDAALGVETKEPKGRLAGVAEVLGRLQSLYRSGYITKVELDERSAEVESGPR